MWALGQRPDEDRLHGHAECHQQKHGQHARDNVVGAEQNDQHVDDECAGHYEVTVPEVHDSRRPVDDCHRKRDERIESALGDAADKQLREHSAIPAGSQVSARCPDPSDLAPRPREGAERLLEGAATRPEAVSRRHGCG